MGRIRTFNRRTNKYNNHAVIIDGIRFDSKGEAARYIELRDFKRTGKITDFECQPKFTLQESFKKRDPEGRLITYAAIKYYADFRVTYPDGHQTIEDVKGWGGYTAPAFKLKQKMFECKFPELHLEVIQRSGKGIEMLDETKRDGEVLNETPTPM